MRAANDIGRLSGLGVRLGVFFLRGRRLHGGGGDGEGDGDGARVCRLRSQGLVSTGTGAGRRCVLVIIG